MSVRAFAALVFVIALATYVGMLDHVLLSDDYLNLERNGFQTVGEGLSLFSTTDVDFYRPVARLHFGLLQGLVADEPVVWNGIGLLLHALASVLAFLLARDLVGDVAGRWAGVLFAVHFIHVEPAVWASAVTSTWVTLFLLATMLLLRRARRTGRARDLALAALMFAGALGSKETAVAFVPLMLLVTWVWPGRDANGRTFPRWPTITEAAPFVILLGAYFLVAIGIDRGGSASPYRMALGGHVFKNLAFFALGGFVPVRYWEVQQIWATSGGATAFLAGVFPRAHLVLPLAIGAIGVTIAALRGGREVRAGLAWILGASLPFLALPGSGERFQYLSSFGACLVLGVGLRAVGRRYPVRWARIPAAGWVGGLVILLFLGGNLDRQSDWRLASRWTRSIIARWDYFKIRDPAERIEFVGVPGQVRSAWVFRNGFGSMVRLYWEGRDYWRQEEAEPGADPDVRMVVLAREDGSVSMLPESVPSDEAVPGPPTPEP
jgi:hypothetical protein